MAEFLTGADLSARIRQLLSHQNVRCAVAFWGSGAAKLLRSCSGTNPSDVKIVCDLSMGGTFPPELTRLGAPDNEKLRYLNGLHAKVYLSDAGAVVASANVSSNGIGFTDKGAGLIEAGTFHARDEVAWQNIAQWFDQIYEDAKPIDEDALALAPWSPPKGAGKTVYPVRANSLLDMVRAEPELFAGIGFVFTRNSPSRADTEKALQAVGKAHTQKLKEIEQWPSGNMFLNWKSNDVRRWPAKFFEFWMPRNRLSVFARETAYLDPELGAVLARPAWPGIKADLKRPLATATEIGKADAALANQVLNTSGNRLFDTPEQLWKVLVELESA
jgi:hypothetical protein